MSDVLIRRTDNARIPNSEQCTPRVQPTFKMVQAVMHTILSDWPDLSFKLEDITSE